MDGSCEFTICIERRKQWSTAKHPLSSLSSDIISLPSELILPAHRLPHPLRHVLLASAVLTHPSENAE